ncbi:MAG: hypothetical protein AVDCRST_MAG22-2251, partial [uncultured Rubrobacteraceae bacterium]
DRRSAALRCQEDAEPALAGRGHGGDLRAGLPHDVPARLRGRPTSRACSPQTTASARTRAPPAMPTGPQRLRRKI